MKNFQIYLSTAPVLAAVWFSALAGMLIELNRFFPDALSFPLTSVSYTHLTLPTILLV